MPATLFIAIIMLSALCGYCIAAIFITLIFYPLKEKRLSGISVYGIVAANQDILAKAIAFEVKKQWLNEEQLTKLLGGTNIMQKLRPEIETHVDAFLKGKIQETFPLLYKFMGDKTLAKFKEAFLAEVEVLFPVLLQSYSSQLLNEIRPEKAIADKINAIDIAQVAKMLRKKAAKQLLKFKILATLIGVITGIIQIFLILLLNK